MSTPDNKSFERNAKAIDEGLKLLRQALGDVMNDMAARLTQETADAADGPLSAVSGLQVRVGGIDMTPGQRHQEDQTGQQTTASKNALHFEHLRTDTGWILSIDIPGVPHHELRLDQDGEALVIKTLGTRRHEGRIEVGGPFNLDDVAMTLRHGVLILEITEGVPQ